MRAHLERLYKILNAEYPDAKCSLDFKDAYQLTVATILSAQCTDVRVNLVTPALFRRFPDAASLAKAKRPELEKLVKTTGFFRAKAKALKEMALSVVKNHGGEIPKDLEDLVKLRGVGRKTANVVRGNAFGLPGFPVDTHVGRLTRRLGLTQETDPVKIEAQITGELDESKWSRFSNLLIFHGRAVCDARKPKCEDCRLAPLCPKVGVSKG